MENENRKERRSPIERMGYTPETFAQRIREYRFRNRMSQSEVGDVMGGMSANTISRWENGKALPKTKMVIERLIKENVL
jgi:ribosome-binding protein aMBF1 (putative translation factor)